ncbi:type IV secretory system conjugative DNA transfer family protein [Streptomyces sp. NBC_01304]|uniref:type IV secretory system conjugative DNA transfer family protein n=1 Tax=Streptomyces sp. NBC_01304 TaxID=2903818 RepID=UPI002E0F40D5|nr:TraM recognition domain-containing protein [Streptomyces sp. NBC_01304]
MSRTTQITDAVLASSGGITGAETPAPAPGTEAPALIENLQDLGEFIQTPAGIALVVIAVFILLGITAGLAWLWGTVMPRPGMATRGEIREVMGEKHAREMIDQTRPSLIGREKETPVTEYALPLGKTRHGWPTSIYATPEDNMLVLGPPRQGKSLFLDTLIYEFPGAVVHTSSKVKDHLNTKDLRQLVGPVWVWDPQRLDSSDISTFKWNPVIGCQDRDVALQRAAYLLYGARKDPGAGIDQFFKDTAAEVLARFLNAAALGKLTMVDVYRWTHARDNDDAIQLLMRHGADQDWINLLRARQNVVEGTGDGIWTTLSSALGWMSNPHVARTVAPGPGEDFDPEKFLLNRGTLYMIGADEPGSAIAPLYVLFLDFLRRAAIRLGNRVGGRMDPPLLMALDEVATIVPVPLDLWMPDSGGKGITLVAAVQSKAQLRSRWGDAKGEVIWGAVNILVVLRGIVDTRVLKELSELCDTYTKTRTTHSRAQDGKVTTSTSDVEKPVMTASQIRKLPRRRLLVFFPGASPVITALRPLYKRRDVKAIRSGKTQVTRARVPGPRGATTVMLDKEDV